MSTTGFCVLFVLFCFPMSDRTTHLVCTETSTPENCNLTTMSLIFQIGKRKHLPRLGIFYAGADWWVVTCLCVIYSKNLQRDELLLSFLLSVGLDQFKLSRSDFPEAFRKVHVLEDLNSSVRLKLV